MTKHLLIVESPAKAKTLHKYLGDDYEVLASYGHVRDLVPKNGAVDPDNQFAMHYELIERNAKHVDSIVKALKKADELLLATDPDREGEAISWHLLELLKERGALKDKVVRRVVFHEITKQAVLQAVASPRELAMDLVNAQQARRALDYLVGFNLSPLLWRKVQPGLSAGRVQSPALRMIVEREREMEAFKTQEYWKITAHLQEKAQKFSANLSVFAGKKVEQFSFTSQAQVDEAIAQLKAGSQGVLEVLQVEKKDRKRNPSPPFTTSTLQQEAARKLRFSAQHTMRVAQRLYEAGFITYMRTDSLNLSEEALTAMRALIKEQYGTQFLPDKARRYATKSKNAQEAHEAVRPTDIRISPKQLSADMGADEHKLYDLIHKRALASQMSSAVLEQLSIDFAAGDKHNVFHATGSTIKFAGFMSVYLEAQDDVDEDEHTLLPQLNVGEKVALDDILGTQHFTAPPPRYSEASLIKSLEEKGIGRPSTYASILSTLQARDYVTMENRRFLPTLIGKVVNDFLTKHFEQYVDYDFTAHLEDGLDAVSRGEENWIPLLSHFWQDFHHRIAEKQDIAREEVMKARELGVDPQSGKPVSVRFGKYGPFVQIGSKDDEEKPRFATIPSEYNLEKITLEEALELFKLPREMGMTDEGEEIVINVGRFGPYVRFGKQFVSIPKDEDPLTVSRERALELIAEKKALEKQKYIAEIQHGDTTLQILNGRFGPYVTDGAVNASIPKKIEPKELTLEEALELLEKARARKGAKTAKAKASTKTTAKKTSTRKTATKKSSTS